MNYEIISDLAQIKRFVATLNQDEKYIVQLAIRNKYANFKVNKNHNVLRSESLLPKNIEAFIKQLQSPIGSFQTHDGQVIKDSTGFVIFISVNSMNEDKFYRLVASDLTDKIINNKQHHKSLNGYLLSQQLKSNNREVVDIEFDYPNPEMGDMIKYQVLKSLNFNKDIVRFIKTRGGMHVLIKFNEIEECVKRTAIRQIKEMEYVDVATARMSVAIPGTLQGSHPVIMLEN